MSEPPPATSAHIDRRVGYARVSTADQNPELQIDALRRDGISDDRIYRERVSSAAKKRPEFNRMMRELRPGDVITVWKLDRLGRTLRQVLDTVDRIKEAGADLRILTQQIDTSTAMGKFFFAMTLAYAELERDLAIERTRAGLAAAADRGRKGGARRQYAEQDIARAAKAFRQGATYKELAPTVLNRRGKAITWMQLKRRIDQHERAKAS